VAASRAAGGESPATLETLLDALEREAQDEIGGCNL
jgi:hypothetical protein